MAESTITERVKKALRVSHNALDDAEITPLIAGAKKALSLAGVVNVKEDDPFVYGAIVAYCRWQFGFDNPDSEKNRAIFESMRNQMSQAAEYTVKAGGGDGAVE